MNAYTTSTVSLPTHRLTFRNANGTLTSVIVPTPSAPTGAPSGYALQAQLEAGI